MIKRTLLGVFLAMVFISIALALTDHREFQKLEIKECNSCHKSSGVNQNHGSFWVKEHRLYAEKQPSNCSQCHQDSFCMDCHKGGGMERTLHTSTSGVDYMPRSHTTDFREIHPIKALDDPKSCYRCHDAKRFCNECHSKFNPNDLRILSHRRGWSDLEVSSGGPKHSTFNTSQCQICHPNSLLPKHQWSSVHAREARKNLPACQTCHPDGNVCIKCHSAKTGLKVNPHPRGWSKISGRLNEASGRRTCVICH